MATTDMPSPLPKRSKSPSSTKRSSRRSSISGSSKKAKKHRKDKQHRRRSTGTTGSSSLRRRRTTTTKTTTTKEDGADVDDKTQNEKRNKEVEEENLPSKVGQTAAFSRAAQLKLHEPRTRVVHHQEQVQQGAAVHEVPPQP